MKIFSLLSLLLLFFTSTIFAQVNPTWSDNVAEIVYNNCSSCHHAGGIAPFALMSYQDAVFNAYGMQAQVAARLMPPWKPDPNYVHFKDERVLSDDDINTLVSWVNAGMPEGDPGSAPEPPVFNPETQMAEVDQTLQLPEWTITSTIDQYRSFVIPAGESAGKYLNQIEYIPGNNAVVHHIVIWADPTSISQDLDDEDPLPGFESNGTMPASPFATLLGAWAPGSGIFELPYDMGIKVQSNYDYVVEIHYAPGSLNQSDSTRINLKFTDAPTIRQVYVDAVLQYFDGMTDGPLFVPANTIQTFHENFTLSGLSVSLIGVFPHMHKIGTSFKSWALNASGDTTRLIDIPKWSFHWQGFYNYQKLIPVFSGSTFWGQAVYDNTTNNPDNPSNPPVDVSAGEKTTDEMMIGFFAYAVYKTGDENVILDSTLITGTGQPFAAPVGIDVYPNPASDVINISIDGNNTSYATFEIFDSKGSLVLSERENTTGNAVLAKQLYIERLPSGIYLLHVVTDSGLAEKKIIKM